MASIRVLIVDDHPVVRDGLRGMLDGDPGCEVVGEASNGAEALDKAKALNPDVILMDLHMPEMDGVRAIEGLVEQESNSRVLVLTTYDDDSFVLPAIEAGATGYLLKDAPSQELLQAVRAVAKGETILSPSVASRLVNQVREPQRDILTKRELEILQLVAEGTTNREIAQELFISVATVKTHLIHIYEKLEAADRAAAVAEGYKRGLLG